MYFQPPAVDYLKTHFEYPELTKVHKNPTYATLKTIKDELKTNAARVTSDLGGGGNGHLGLVLTPAEYALVSAVPYNRPVHPGPLVLPAGPGVTNLQREIARDTHREEVRVFREVVELEKTLLKQLVQALPALYTKSFRNQHSNSITTPISDVLTTLIRTYGKVSDEELQQETAALRSKIFDISEPLVAMYDEIEELKALSIAAESEYTEPQLVNLGVQLIKNMNDYERGLETWLSQPAAARTWLAFKTHFTEAQEQLRRIRGPTMRNAAFTNTANSIITSVREELNGEREKVFQRIDATEASIINALTASSGSESTEEDTVSTLTEKANVTTQDKVQLEILKLLKEIRSDIVANKPTADNNNEKNPRWKKRPYKRTDTRFYCWSCGAWNHKSKDCKRKKEGHRDEATFENKLGGSTYYCSGK